MAEMRVTTRTYTEPCLCPTLRTPTNPTVHVASCPATRPAEMVVTVGLLLPGDSQRLWQVWRWDG